jgi:hypothetical protein
MDTVKLRLCMRYNYSAECGLLNAQTDTICKADQYWNQ